MNAYRKTVNILLQESLKEKSQKKYEQREGKRCWDNKANAGHKQSK